MKTVLLLAYQYPPLLTTAARRSGCMAKYLPCYGWRPVVVSRSWTSDNGQCDPEFVRNLPSDALVAAVSVQNRLESYPACVLMEMFLHPLTYPHKWTERTLRILPQIIARYKPDIIWATCVPHATHYLADNISREMGIPWVADFRDVLGQFGSDERLPRRLLNSRIAPLEKHLVKSASAITTVSEGLAQILQDRHQQEVHVVQNGFDADDYIQTAQGKQDKFSIRYFGSLYTSRNPSALFAAIDSLQRKRLIQLNDIQIQFYGADCAHAASLARDHCCRQVIECHPMIPHGEAIRLQQNSSVLLVLSGARGKGILTGKVFEYLAAQRPILCAPSDGDCIDHLLRETNAGVSCATVDEVASQLLKWYQEWRSTGTTCYCGRLDVIAKYSRKSQAGQLAELLDSTVADRGVLQRE